MQRGFGLISLLIVSALTGVILQGYFHSTMTPLTRDPSGESVRPDRGARLTEAQGLLTRTMVALTLCAQAKGLSASLFATPDGTITRGDASGGPPPPSPSSGQGC